MKTIEGSLQCGALRIAIVAARFNSLVVEPLIAGALEAMRRNGGDPASAAVYRCPGAFELPQVARRVAMTGRFDAVICLAAVVRGGTPHFDYVCSAATSGLTALMADAPCAIGFGVLTTDTLEQALDRAGGKSGNKGYDAALAAIETAHVLKQVT